jgi:hypothetical protein
LADFIFVKRVRDYVVGKPEQPANMHRSHAFARLDEWKKEISMKK